MQKTAFIIVIVLACLSPRPACGDGKAECRSHHEGPIAIFIDPTDGDIERMKMEEGEEDFYTIADDSLYYNWEAVDFLKERGFPYCFTKDKSHEFTVMGTGVKYHADRECEGWCLILFNGKSKPVWANAAEIFMFEGYLSGAE